MTRFILSIILLLPLASAAQQQKRTAVYQYTTDSLLIAEKRPELVSYFEKELKKYPKDAEVMTFLAYAYRTVKDYGKADKYYTEAMKLSPACICDKTIAYYYIEQKQYSKALEWANKAVSQNPKNDSCYIARALIKQAGGDRNGPMADYNKAVELEPGNISNRLDRADYNSSLGSFYLALGDYNEIIDMKPGMHYAYAHRADLYFSKGLFPEALADLNKAIALDSNIYNYYASRGSVYAYMQQNDSAMADYNKALSISSNDYMTYYYRALLYYQKEDMDASCRDMEISYRYAQFQHDSAFCTQLKATIDNYCNNSKASYYYQRGIAFYNLGQYENAEKIYSEGLKKFPDNGMTLSFRGNALFQMKEYARALADYENCLLHLGNVKADAIQNLKDKSDEAVQLYCNGFLASNYLCMSECKFALGRYTEALKDINTAITYTAGIEDIGLENYYNVKGNINLALSRFEEAKEDFNRCIQLKPGFAIAYTNRAIATVNTRRRMAMKSLSVSGGDSKQAFKSNWNFGKNTSIKKGDASMALALADCDKAIQLDSQLAYGYYIRGQLKNMLGDESYCYDMIKAKTLGMPVEIEWLADCK